jgi:predicted nucleic acid-binding protein
VVTTTYLDASAIVKILLREADAGAARSLWRTAERRTTSVVAYVEARAAIAAAVRDRRLAPVAVEVLRLELDRRWRQCQPVALDDRLLSLAASVGDREGLRALDAIHLATALYVADARTLFVTWDRRLADAAIRLGLAVAPASLL